MVMKKITLNDGKKIPQLGFGLYQVPDDESCVNYVKDALQMGYRLLDTAASYENERSVGKGIRESGIPREEIFVTSKMWVQDYGYEAGKKAIDASLDRLGLDYMDLYLLHRPAGDNVGAYKAMEEALLEGKIRSIGVCNHSVGQLNKLIEATTVVPAVDQMECHPLQQEKELRTYLDKKGIALQSWFPLGHGSKRLRFNETLTALAEKYKRSVSQIMLRWHIQEGFVAIPKSMNPDHMKENLAIFDFDLEEEDMEMIRGLDANRYFAGDPEDPEKLRQYLTIHFDI